jgi:hypothetical protein
VAATASALGLGALVPSGRAAEPGPPQSAGAGTDFQAWLNSIKGKYRQVYDAPEPNNGMAFIWSHVYFITGVQGYGVPESDLGVVVVLRHEAIPIAFNHGLWAKYKLGEFFKINDPATRTPATRNPFANIKPGDMPFPEAALDKARGTWREVRCVRHGHHCLQWHRRLESADGREGGKTGLGRWCTSRRADRPLGRCGRERCAGARLQLLFRGLKCRSSTLNSGSFATPHRRLGHEQCLRRSFATAASGGSRGLHREAHRTGEARAWRR